MFGPRFSVDPNIHPEARAGRCVPTNWLPPTHRHGRERRNGSAVRASRHAARIVRPLAPQRRRSRRFESLRALATTLRRQAVAHAVSCIYRRRIEQEYCRDGQCLEEGSHEGEVQVYRSGESLQQIPIGERRPGGETGGAGCRIVGEERVQCGVRFHPPVRLGGERRVP
jgi:hypothetical protein